MAISGKLPGSVDLITDHVSFSVLYERVTFEMSEYSR